MPAGHCRHGCDIGDPQQWIARGFYPNHPGRSGVTYRLQRALAGKVDELCLELPFTGQAGKEPVATTVTVMRNDQPVSRIKQRGDECDRRHAGPGDHRGCTSLQLRQRGPELITVGVGRSRIVIASRLTERLESVVGGQVQGRHDGAMRRVALDA